MSAEFRWVVEVVEVLTFQTSPADTSLRWKPPIYISECNPVKLYKYLKYLNNNVWTGILSEQNALIQVNYRSSIKPAFIFTMNVIVGFILGFMPLFEVRVRKL